MTVTEAPPDGDWPIWYTDTLLERIKALPDSSVLAEIWVDRQWPKLTEAPLVDQATFHKMEREVAYWEQDCSSLESGQIRGWRLRLLDLPEHARVPAFEHINVLAGTTDNDMAQMGHGSVTTVGRIKVIEQIVHEAIHYADTPSPADRQAEADAQAEAEAAEALVTGAYPGAKATMPAIKTWIGDDLNRAAAAYAHELDRPSERKTLLKWIEALLGEERLEVLRQAMASSAAPPLQLVKAAEAAEQSQPPAPVEQALDAEAAAEPPAPAEKEAEPPAPAEKEAEPPAPVDHDDGDAGEDGEGLGTPDAGSAASVDQGSVAPGSAPSEIETDELAEAIAIAGQALLRAARLLRGAA